MTPDQASAAQQSLHEFAIQEGIRTLQHQEAELARIRDRVIALAGLTAAAAAFLVGAALQAKTRGWRFYAPMAVGTASYCLLLIKSWKLLTPTRGWRAKVSASVLVEDFASREPSDAYKYLAGFYTKAQEANDALLAPMRKNLQWALGFAGATVVSFIILTWLVAH